MLIFLISAACAGDSTESAQIPTAAGISQPAAIPYGDQGHSQERSLQDSQDAFSSLYPGPVDLDDSLVTEVPPTIVEPTVWLGHNPELAEIGIPTYSYNIINKFPHDRGSYIQGLVVADDPDVLLEGSGLLGESTLRRVDLETGEVTQLLTLPSQYFGEGITLFDDRIIQLTWKSRTGFIYDSDSFRLLDIFSYEHEGWGITYDGQQLIVSDGTPTIHFWDAETLQETRKITVHDEYGPVSQINELEYMDDEILANIWQTDTIIRIDPESGQVTSRIDLSGILAEEDREGTEGVLNGIAYESKNGRLYVTGKKWPTLYEIELVLENAPQ